MFDGIYYANAQLKKLLAEAIQNIAMLKDIASEDGDALGETGRRCPPPCGVRGERSVGVLFPSGGPVVSSNRSCRPGEAKGCEHLRTLSLKQRRFGYSDFRLLPACEGAL